VLGPSSFAWVSPFPHEFLGFRWSQAPAQRGASLRRIQCIRTNTRYYEDPLRKSQHILIKPLAGKRILRIRPNTLYSHVFARLPQMFAKLAKLTKLAKIWAGKQHYMMIFQRPAFVNFAIFVNNANLQSVCLDIMSNICRLDRHPLEGGCLSEHHILYCCPNKR